jgi:hypothetical protein
MKSGARHLSAARHQPRFTRLVVFFFTIFLALLCLPTAFRPADDFVFLGGRPAIVRLTFLVVFFALVANSAIMCSSSDLLCIFAPRSICDLILIRQASLAVDLGESWSHARPHPPPRSRSPPGMLARMRHSLVAWGRFRGKF